MTFKTVVQIIPAMGTGGAEQACADVACALVAKGRRALVVSSGGWRVPLLERQGVEHVLFPVHTKNPARILGHAFWLARLLREKSADLVHVRSRAPAWSAWLACRMTHTPFVTTFHAAYAFSSAPKKIYNSVMARGDRVIAISAFIARHVRETYGVGEERLRVIDRGIDVCAFDPLRVEESRKEALRKVWQLESEDVVALLPARLSPIKGHDVLISALQEMKKRGEKIPLAVIVGDDQGRVGYVASLRESIAAAGLCSRVRFVGACQDMPAAYALADVVLAPSRVPEGFGRVPVEAMAAGVPVIASALGASLDTVVDGETGWLLPPENTAAWAEKMGLALSLSQERRALFAQKGRVRAAERYDFRVMVEKTLDVYEDLCASK